MTILTVQVSAGSDDCYVRKSDDVFSLVDSPTVGYWNSSYYKLGGAFRFDNITVPKNATINSAKLIVRAYTTRDTNGVKSRIRVQLADDPTTFTTLSDYNGRPKSTDYVQWDINSTWTANTEYQSPDIAYLIQMLVNRSGWASGNAIVVFWDDHDDQTPHSWDEDARDVFGYENGASYACKLEIDYSTGVPPSGIEDFATSSWVETDPNTHITVTSPKVLSAGVNRNEDCYVTRDMGAGQITDISYDFTFRTIYATHDNATLGIICLTNTKDDISGQTPDGCILLMTSGGSTVCNVMLGNNELTRDVWTAGVKNTTYYATLKRSGGTVTCDIYSDEARTNKLKTLTLGTSLQTAFRYIMVIVSHNIGGDYPTANPDGYIENLKLSGTTPQPPPPSPSGSYAVFSPPLFNLS
jgi:hypothetical protein